MNNKVENMLREILAIQLNNESSKIGSNKKAWFHMNSGAREMIYKLVDETFFEVSRVELEQQVEDAELDARRYKRQFKDALESEHRLSDSYLTIRKFAGTLDLPPGTTPEEIRIRTEQAVYALKCDAQKEDLSMSPMSRAKWLRKLYTIEGLKAVIEELAHIVEDE